MHCCSIGRAVMSQIFASSSYRTIVAQTEDQRSCNECWIMLEIHDWKRFLQQKPDRADLLFAAAGWLMTAPGTPVVYYGIEQGFNGVCQSQPRNCGDACESIEHTCQAGDSDTLKRQDMFASEPWRLGSVVPEIKYAKHWSNYAKTFR